METQKTRKPRTSYSLDVFGKFCRKIRIDLDIDIVTWAKELETSSQTVNAYEYGRKTPDIIFLGKLSKLIATKAPQYLQEFTEQFTLSQNVVFTSGLSVEQMALIKGVLNGSVRLSPSENETESVE